MKFYKDFELKEFVAEGKGYTLEQYIEGLPDGKYYFQYKYDKREKHCISVKNGKKNGVEETYIDGKINKITNYEDGGKQGFETLYREDGTKTSERYYENGFMLYEIHFQRKKEKTLEQIKQLERVLKELKESVEKTQCKGLSFID